MSSTIYVATSSRHPDLTADDNLMVRAANERGLKARPLVWTNAIPNDPDGVVLIRSCWDYHLAYEPFRNWIQKASERGLRFVNGADRILWSLDKRYLLELASEGIPIPETDLVEMGSRTTLADAAERIGASRVVVKPTVSLSAHATWRAQHPFTDADEQRFAAQIADHDVLVQPFLEEIEQGEWSAIFFGDRYSHSVLKTAARGDFRVQNEHGGTHVLASPSPSLVSQAREVILAAGGPFPYARVDFVERGDQLLLMELELVDPVLFLGPGGRSAVKLFVDQLGAKAT